LSGFKGFSLAEPHPFAIRKPGRPASRRRPVLAEDPQRKRLVTNDSHTNLQPAGGGADALDPDLDLLVGGAASDDQVLDPNLPWADLGELQRRDHLVCGRHGAAEE
jgi:hypothetical protein